jgi:TonB family protein
MKICPTCQQQYPNGFQYCPNDTDMLITSEEFIRRTKPIAQTPPLKVKAEAKVIPPVEPLRQTRQMSIQPPATDATEPLPPPSLRPTEPVNLRAAAPPAPAAVTGAAAPSVGSANVNKPNAQAAKAGANGGASINKLPSPVGAGALVAASSLSFSVPEQGSLIARLGAALRNFSDSFGKGGGPLKPGATGDFQFLLKEETLVTRFGRELQSAADDFKRDPKTFVVATLKGEGSSKQRRRWLLNGIAMALIAYSFFFFVIPTIAILLWGNSQVTLAKEDEALEKMVDLAAIPTVEAKVEKPQKGNGSKQMIKKAAGGGGGGRQQPTPPSKGVPPQMALTPQIVMPNPEPPKIKNASLVVAQTVYGDPKALPPVKGPIGDPLGVPAPPSSGPGKGAGVGSGEGTGVGRGQGGGLGPGRGGNTGGGDMDIGGGRGGIEEMGKNGVGKPIILYREKARYTEEARQNKVQGVVVLSVIFTSDGRITNIKVVRSLPDGLTEKAIEAAQRIRFQPATKNGAAVSVRGNLEFSFNLY